ncbi:MAG: hypothetical protein HZC41_19585 [Chloroflexi bacterium]|nr:hypothetical protein [Chloroflexota bacterium]
MRFYALTLTDKIGRIDGFPSEAELDEFAIEMSSFSDEERAEREAEGNTYGPPIVFALLARDLDAVEENNYERPFAVYLRGERYDCVKRGS